MFVPSINLLLLLLLGKSPYFISFTMLHSHNVVKKCHNIFLPQKYILSISAKLKPDRTSR